MRRMDATAGGLSRRDWGWATALGAAGWFVGDSALAAQAQTPTPAPVKTTRKPIPIRTMDVAQIETVLQKAGVSRVHKLRSTHYEAIGDSSDGFMKTTLGDCEQLAVEFLRHFESRGFELHAPDQTLLLVTLRDERSFGRFLQTISAPSAASKAAGAQVVGAYDRSTNLLNLFDWRNVPMASRSSHKNAQTIAHEGTHQLTFNTGLLNRSGDVPLAVIEGLGAYGEPRKVIGPSSLGRTNLERLDNLAKLQRMVDWIPLRALLTDDEIFRKGMTARVLLGYAQGWLLVHFLLHDGASVPRFRDYLKAIHPRKTDEHRIDDATKHLGDLDALDRTLKAYSIRLLRSL